jgi:hypothetical protein
MLGKLTWKPMLTVMRPHRQHIREPERRIDSVEVNSIFTECNPERHFHRKDWDGNIKIADRNIRLDMLGMLDFSNELPEFDFT